MQFILFFICQCFWIGFHRKGKHLTAFLFDSDEKSGKKSNKRKLNTSINTHSWCAHTSHKYWYNLHEMCSMNFEPSVFFYQFLSKVWRKNWKTSMFTQELDGMVWISFVQTHWIWIRFKCSGKKDIAHCEYHSLWHARNVPEKMAHTWSYTFVTKFLASAFSISYMPMIKIGVSTLYPKREIVCLLDTVEQ